jgi:flagellar motility protein MotE (MotC chaperone)
MTDKKTTSLSIDADLKRAVSQREELNLSGVVNDFLRGYLAHGDATAATLEARLEHLQRKNERLLKQVDEVEQEIAHVEELLEAQREAAETDHEEIERLAHDLPEDLSVENPAVKNWARKLNRRPKELVELVEKHRANGAASSSA